MAQPALVPERLIGYDPDFHINHLLDRWAGKRGALDTEAVAQYVREFQKPSVIAASRADYRAGASVDVMDDKADRGAGRRIRCPVLVIWGRGYLAEQASSPLEARRAWADQVNEVVLDCGHFCRRGRAGSMCRALLRFFAATDAPV